MKGERMKKANSKLTEAQRAELEALAALPEEQINTHDIPEQTDWRGAQRGLFFRPIKQQLALAAGCRRDCLVQGPCLERRGLSDSHQQRPARIRRATCG